MSEENVEAKEEKNEESDKSTDVSDSKADNDESKGGLDEETAYYSRVAKNIDKAYRDSPEFKEAFDKAWNEHVLKKGGDSNRNPTTAEKVDLVQKLSGEINELRNVYVNDKKAGFETGVDRDYAETTVRLLADAGYEPGTKAFDLIMSSVKDKGIRLSHKYNLYNSNTGKIDLSKGYNEKFIREVVSEVMKDYKELGYEDTHKTRLKAEQEKKRQSEQKDWKKDLFGEGNKNLLGGHEKRAAVIKQAFNRIISQSA